jgi:xanthine dehydrogenase accessory factor
MARMKGDGQPFALATVVRTEDATAAKAGAKAVVRGDGTLVGWIGGGCTLAAVRRTAAAALVDGRARLIRVTPREDEAAASPDGVEEHTNRCPSRGTVELFVEPVLPRPALIVCGATPTARALADLGRRAGFAVTVAALSEDQGAFADADARIEGFDLSRALNAAAAAVVVATQGKRDREALTAAVASGAPYVAFVGSRKKAATLIDTLRTAGMAEDRLSAVHAPAGLDIGAATAEEIALSILAEIVQDRRRPEAAAAVTVETVEGGEYEAQVVSPVLGTCRGSGGVQ